MVAEKHPQNNSCNHDVTQPATLQNCRLLRLPLTAHKLGTTTTTTACCKQLFGDDCDVWTRNYGEGSRTTSVNSKKMVAEKTFKPYVFSTIAFVAILGALLPYTLDVFGFLSDVRLLDLVHPYRIEARDIQHFSDLELNYTSVERVDYVKGVYSTIYAFPVWVQFAKINHGYQIRSTYDVLNGTLVARQAFTVTAAKHAGRNGTFLTDKNLMECPWIYSYATYWKAREAHREILEGMKQLLERKQVHELNLPSRYLTGSDVISQHIRCAESQ
ncbi:hypothetical protein Bbelb_367330 [Branchiostoma belcheri]|nr:hypothetical protein Bbelb_367330 [Branchiostoma belcheri]